MNDDIAQLRIHIDSTALSDRRLNDITLKLKHELSHLRPAALDVQRDTNVPAGTMSIEAFTLGALTLAVLPTTIPAIIEYIRDWSLRNANRTISIKRRIGEEEIEVSFPEDVSPERLQQLIGNVSSTVAKPDTNNQK